MESPGYYSKTDISGQIDADALLSVTPPPQMPATMEAGTIYGNCIGEPWNQQAVFKGISVPVYQSQYIYVKTAHFLEQRRRTTSGWLTNEFHASQRFHQLQNA